MKKYISIVLALVFVLALALVSSASVGVADAYAVLTVVGSSDTARVDAVGGTLTIPAGDYTNVALWIPVDFTDTVESVSATLNLSVTFDDLAYSASDDSAPSSTYPLFFGSVQSLRLFVTGGSPITVPCSLRYVCDGYNYLGTAAFRAYVDDWFDTAESTDVLSYTMVFDCGDMVEYREYLDDVNSIVIGSGFLNVENARSFTVAYDIIIDQSTIFAGLGTFIPGLFGGVNSVVLGLLDDPLLSMFVVYIPLAAVALVLIFKVIGKKRKGRVRK